MDGRQQSAQTGPVQEGEGSSQIDVRQTKVRPTEAPKVRCAVCNSELDELVATKAESRDQVVYFCDLECFGEWERARSDL